MPIRFACPHCHQKLSVSSRKAGTSADCPRCKKKLSIPTPPPEPQRPAPAKPQVASPPPVSQPPVSQPPVSQPPIYIGPETSPAEEFQQAAAEPFVADAAPAPEAAVAIAEPPPEAQAAASIDVQTAGHIETQPVENITAPSPAEDAIWTPDPVGYEGMELVYDTTESATTSQPVFAEHTELVAIPRYVLYLQGGLIGVVALVAFAIGMLAGGAILTQPPPPAEAQACVINGSVTYASGPRQLPDEGAVIALIPQTHAKPDEKAPVAGLRPDDPTPGDTHRGIAILRGLGGGYARADANGRFQVQLPDRGRYLVLVVSSRSQVRSIEQIQTADIFKLGPFFDNAADLLGNHQYKLTQETVRGDRDLDVAFE